MKNQEIRRQSQKTQSVWHYGGEKCQNIDKKWILVPNADLDKSVQIFLFD